MLGLAFVWWALTNESGSARLVSWLPNVTVVAPKGSLVGDFAADRIDVALPGTLGTLRLEAPRWKGLSLARGNHGRWLRVAVVELHAGRAVRLPPATTPPPSSEPDRPPATLRLPFELSVGALTIGELQLAGAGGDATPIRDLRARLHLGADDGRVHLIDDASATRDRARASAQLRLAADAPFAVDARLRGEALAPAPASTPIAAAPAGAASAAAAASAPAWQAEAVVAGPLDALRVTANVRASPSPTHPAQSLDASVLLHPFAAWPIGALQATTSALDLSAFAAGWPATSLSGSAVATTKGRDAPALVALDLANARAGRWNEGRLPVRRLRGELRARPDDPSRVDAGALHVELGSDALPGGTIDGSAAWSPERWTIEATLDGVEPAALDARAPAQRLGGRVSASGSGFADAVPAAASAPAAPRAVARRVDVRAALAGVVPAGPLRVELDAGWIDAAGTTTLELRRADATSAESRASATGTLTRRAEATPRVAGEGPPWLAKGELRLVAFDPAVWWPDVTPAWRDVKHRVDATGRFDLAIPAQGVSAVVVEALAALRGSAELALAESTLAGVAVQGRATFANSAGIAELKAALDAAGNRFDAEARLAGASQPAADRWRVVVAAPQLQRLAPLLRAAGVSPARTGADVVGGAIAGTARGEGRWPQLETNGEWKATDLRFAEYALRSGEGRWRLGSAAGTRLEAKLVAVDARSGDASLERVEVDLAGTAAAHRLQLRAESKALPPAWVDAVRAPAAAASAGTPRSSVAIDAEGGLVDVSGVRASGWRGTLQRVEIGRAGAPDAPWLAARALRGAVDWGGGETRVVVEPGSANVLGAVVRWQQAAWRSGPPPARSATALARATTRLDLRADVEPMPLAPILARMQPDFGWGGDLRVGARIDVRSTPTPAADVVIERAGGDLTVTDEYGTQPLGLTDLRLGVAAQDGVWNFTQALAGQTLGATAGAIVARTGDPAAWPDARTPIEGVLELRVANLGTWGTWVPAGWRLGGALHASAAIAGTLGAPEYTGRVDGSALSVRSFVQGVNVSDGELAIALAGTSARIERFTAKAGGGTAQLEGDASLGATPTAQLRLTLERFLLLGRVDRRIVASGSAALRLDRDALGLDGRFAVDEGLIDFTRGDAPSLDSDVVVVRRRGDDPRLQLAAADAMPPRPVRAAAAASAPAPEPRAPATRKVGLDVRVELGEKLRVRGRGLDASLRGELHLTSPNNRLAVAGTVRAVDGTYAAYGQKLVIDRGVLAFAGDVANPRLDIQATRPNLDVRVGVAVTGTAQNPRVRLFSEPELSEIDKLSWLVLGRAGDGVGRTDTALLQRAALALLAGEGPGATDRIAQALGIDEISVRQSDGEGVRETFVGLGKQISKRWYIGYERGLNATTGSWQLIYRIARRLTVRAQAGGDNAIDLIWTIRWK